MRPPIVATGIVLRISALISERRRVSTFGAPQIGTSTDMPTSLDNEEAERMSDRTNAPCESSWTSIGKYGAYSVGSDGLKSASTFLCLKKLLTFFAIALWHQIRTQGAAVSLSSPRTSKLIAIFRIFHLGLGGVPRNSKRGLVYCDIKLLKGSRVG
jgi:hypothetical protein